MVDTNRFLLIEQDSQVDLTVRVAIFTVCSSGCLGPRLLGLVSRVINRSNDLIRGQGLKRMLLAAALTINICHGSLKQNTNDS